MNENNSQTHVETPAQEKRRSKQYGFQPSPYADKKPVTMRLSREARSLLDAEARNENTSVTELVEQIVRQRVLVFPDGEKLSVVDFPVDRDEMRRNQESAHAEIARLVTELDTTRDKWKAATDSLEVYSTDAARFLSRAEAAENEASELRAENHSIREELREIQSDLADWYEFGPPTDHTKKKATALRDEITRLQTELQAAKSITPITENPNSTKKPVYRFSFASILKRWPEARRNRYNKLPSMPTEWVNFTLETAYDMLDELE